jgi:hypothetical protein
MQPVEWGNRAGDVPFTKTHFQKEIEKMNLGQDLLSPESNSFRSD